MARRTKEQAQATRDLILDMAEVEFHRRGVSRTSLQDIARAAGLTRGAIYWHFADKSDLFNAMLSRVTLPLEREMDRSGDPAAADPLAQIRHGFLAALHTTVKDPQARRVLEIATHKVEYVDELAAVRDRHVLSFRERVAHIERGLQNALRAGRLPAGTSVRNAALGLHALIVGLLQNWMLEPADFDLLEVGEATIDVYLAGLRAGSAVVRPGGSA